MVISAFDAIKIDKDHFFVSNEFNGLIKYDEESDLLKLIEIFLNNQKKNINNNIKIIYLLNKYLSYFCS